MLHRTCFHADAESLLQDHIEVPERCGHHNFDLEACPRPETRHRVLGLFYLGRHHVECVCDRLCVSVVQTQGGEVLLCVKFPCQQSGGRCGVNTKGSQGDWN